ncbi:hypothetical protein NZK32_08750 [Cyanobium sp. FGCU-52]|nr:hypothetical protein [Cyanobium sp. FGCU52]
MERSRSIAVIASLPRQAGLLAQEAVEEGLGGIRGMQDQLLALQQQRQAHEGLGEAFVAEGQHQRLPEAFVEAELRLLARGIPRPGAEVAGLGAEVSGQRQRTTGHARHHPRLAQQLQVLEQGHGSEGEGRGAISAAGERKADVPPVGVHGKRTNHASRRCCGP